MGPFVPGHSSGHLVQFYEHDEFLHVLAARYVGAGLRAHEPLIVFASPSSQGALREGLRKDGHEVDRACDSGLLVFLDARETIEQFVVGSVPDAARFHAVVGDTIKRSAAAWPHSRVRIFGEMVDLLCRDGDVQGAIEVERFWNDLAQTHKYRLLCTYALASFGREGHGELFRRVCGMHTRVVPTEAWPDGEPPDVRRRWIASLQQRALALQYELDRCKYPDNAKPLPSGLVICMYCHKIQDEPGHWERVEEFISARIDALLSHGVCPECIEKHCFE